MCPQVDEELADIDLTDPELNKAATKIQASFRGHKVRKDDDGKESQWAESVGYVSCRVFRTVVWPRAHSPTSLSSHFHGA